MRSALRNRCSIVIISFSILGSINANAKTSPAILADADQRPIVNLNNDWSAIIDPYFDGLYTYHHEIRNEGYFLIEAPRPESNKRQPGTVNPHRLGGHEAGPEGFWNVITAQFNAVYQRPRVSDLVCSMEKQNGDPT